jgi:hypothetical protein
MSRRKTDRRKADRFPMYFYDNTIKKLEGQLDTKGAIVSRLERDNQQWANRFSDQMAVTAKREAQIKSLEEDLADTPTGSGQIIQGMLETISEKDDIIAEKDIKLSLKDIEIYKLREGVERRKEAFGDLQKDLSQTKSYWDRAFKRASDTIHRA